MYSYLNKDSEEDDRDDGSKEHLSHGKVFVIQQETKGEGDGTSEATVGHNKLVFSGQFDDAELVDNVGQTNNTWKRQRNEKLTLDLFVTLYVRLGTNGGLSSF